jgi:hypothetical protein
MRLDCSGAKIIQIFIVTNRFILDHAYNACKNGGCVGKLLDTKLVISPLFKNIQFKNCVLWIFNEQIIIKRHIFGFVLLINNDKYYAITQVWHLILFYSWTLLKQIM